MKKAKPADLGIRWCQYLFDIYLGLLFSVFILLCVPYAGIAEFKYWSFLFICGGFAVLTLVFVIQLLFLGQIQFKTLRGLIAKQKTLLCLVGLYLLFTALSAAFSPYEYNVWKGHSRFEGLLTQIIYMAILLLSAIFGRIRKWHIYLLCATSLLFSLLCIAQLAGYNPLGLYPAGYNYHDAYVAYSGEYVGTIGNADLVSGFLCTVVTMLLTCALIKRDKHQYALLISLVFNAAVLLLIGVAAGILSFAVTTFILLPFVAWLKKSRGLKYLLIAQGTLALAAAVLIYVHDFGGNGTLYELHELLHGRIDGSFGSHRIQIWENVLRKMPNHLLLGTGPDSMGLWELTGFTKYVDHLGYYVEQGVDIAHNEYLNVAAQQGLLSFAAYISIIGFALFKFFRQDSKKAKIILIAPVTAYLIQAFFGFSMCIVAPIFWTILGILLNEKEILFDYEDLT